MKISPYKFITCTTSVGNALSPALHICPQLVKLPPAVPKISGMVADRHKPITRISISPILIKIHAIVSGEYVSNATNDTQKKGVFKKLTSLKIMNP